MEFQKVEVSVSEETVCCVGGSETQIWPFDSKSELTNPREVQKLLSLFMVAIVPYYISTEIYSEQTHRIKIVFI